MYFKKKNQILYPLLCSTKCFYLNACEFAGNDHLPALFHYHHFSLTCDIFLFSVWYLFLLLCSSCPHTHLLRAILSVLNTPGQAKAFNLPKQRRKNWTICSNLSQLLSYLSSYANCQYLKNLNQHSFINA